MTSMFRFFLQLFFLSSVLASAYLLAFRIEVFFLIERLPWLGLYFLCIVFSTEPEAFRGVGKWY